MRKEYHRVRMQERIKTALEYKLLIITDSDRTISYPAPRTTQPYSGGTEIEIIVLRFDREVWLVVLFGWIFCTPF